MLRDELKGNDSAENEVKGEPSGGPPARRRGKNQ